MNVIQTLWCWSNVYLGWKVAQARSRALPQDKQAAYWEQRHEHFANLVWDNIKELKGTRKINACVLCSATTIQPVGNHYMWRASS